MTYTYCETSNAITWHIRELEPGEKKRPSGNPDRPLTLCGMESAWDILKPEVIASESRGVCASCRLAAMTRNRLAAMGKANT